MTLTEEQREALISAIDSLSADACDAIRDTKHGEYIQAENQNEIKILQAMIDSSEQFSDATKMIGFDLEKARATNELQKIAIVLAEKNVFIKKQDAEIKRLRAENEGLSKTVIDIQEERDLAQAEFRSYHRAWEEQAARVQELEEALVEMVATNPCNIPTLCDVVHDELMCPDTLDGNCEFWKGCPQKNELREAARKQLQAEGKIGPDVGAKPHCWQITKERKDVLRFLLSGEFSRDCGCEYCRRALETVRAMLTEVGQ